MRRKVSYVVGPQGTVLTLANLPPADTVRWVTRRKAEVIHAVEGGLLSVEEACARYRLSIEEFMSWQADYRAGGQRRLTRAALRDKQRRRSDAIYGDGAGSIS